LEGKKSDFEKSSRTEKKILLREIVRKRFERWSSRKYLEWKNKCQSRKIISITAFAYK
jgi:hypothetical protein